MFSLSLSLSLSPSLSLSRSLAHSFQSSLILVYFSGEINPLVLSRLLFCFGQIAFLQMVHCEVVVAMELKNKRASDDITDTAGKTPSSSRKVSN